MAIIKIEKLLEFAKDGQKSIQGLSLLLGFPRDEKPARDWFNYLFNKSFLTINLLIDEIDKLQTELDVIKENTPKEDIPDDGLPPVVIPNPTGGWTVETPPRVLPYKYSGLSGLALVHNSGQKVFDVQLEIKQIRISDGYQDPNGYRSTRDTDENGRISIDTLIKYDPGSFSKADYIVTSPNTTAFTQRYYIWDGTPYSSTGGGGGGNENQTE